MNPSEFVIQQALDIARVQSAAVQSGIEAERRVQEAKLRTIYKALDEARESGQVVPVILQAAIEYTRNAR